MRFKTPLVGALALFPTLLGFASCSSSTPATDRYVVILGPDVGDEPRSGRLILFFISETGEDWAAKRPIDGPFFERPQPIASIEVGGLTPGGSVVLDGSAVAWPDSVDVFDGPVRIQAILDTDDTERSPLAGPGNLVSDIVETTVSSGRADTIELTLDRAVEPFDPGPETRNLFFVELRSELLSEFYARDAYHRAGVALPPHHDDPDWHRQEWPAIYVVPGFGRRHDEARSYADMLTVPAIDEVVPMAVYVVLDPESPLGHHGFTDSPNHGPRGTALVRELIPHLEERFRLVPRPEARLLTGHSSGGWSSLWLQLHWPEVFGGCWSSAPDPIDFRAFQRTNLYLDESLYQDEGGEPTPSYRRVVGPGGETAVLMTVAEECGMEYAMHPLGGSGQQWDAWEAMFSPRDETTGFPMPMFDARTGAIDHDLVETHWSRWDVTRMVAADWKRYGPTIQQRVRLACGTLDSFYLERAVAGFKQLVEARAEEDGGWQGEGFIRLVEGATHDNLTEHIDPLWNETMREHLVKHRLQDAEPPHRPLSRGQGGRTPATAAPPSARPSAPHGR